MQKILFTNAIADTLRSLSEEMHPSSVHIITDSNVAAGVLPALALPWPVIITPPGDVGKNLDTLASIWTQLIGQGATRRSFIINIGGGVITDMGGFAAATFKRGVRFINVPTTLLSAVDAAVGGKTGINFLGFKNEIGVFRQADAVLISSATFASLPREEMLSGYAEMLKHGLLESPEAYGRLLAYDITDGDLDALLPLLEESVKVKERIVTEDPYEHGIRRALNLGHTAGHAFESLALHRGTPVPHGYAVAWGMLMEMVLSSIERGFPSVELYRYASYLREHGYGAPAITCADYDELVALMRHDKKNSSPDCINFTLLDAPGSPVIDCTAPEATIREALDIFRDLLGL